MVIYRFFEMEAVGRPPSWICSTGVWTTCEEYLVVYITMQNFVRIKVVVPI